MHQYIPVITVMASKIQEMCIFKGHDGSQPSVCRNMSISSVQLIDEVAAWEKTMGESCSRDIARVEVVRVGRFEQNEEVWELERCATVFGYPSYFPFCFISTTGSIY